jgi:thioesterase domain-containing protein
VLGIEGVGIHDDFFKMGGNSLSAIRLFDRIAFVTGQDFPVTMLIEYPTIALLAQSLHARNWKPDWKSLIPVQTTGAKPPLFLVPPAGGSVLRFVELARQLGHDQPVYGLEQSDFDDRQPPLACVEEMASAYLNEIRRVQPNGPYLLAGVCFGGLVALEMAAQLNRLGTKVQLVAVLDATPPAFGPSWMPIQYPVKYYWQRIKYYWSSGKLSHKLIQRLRCCWTEHGNDELNSMTASQRYRKKILDTQVRAQWAYRAPKYKGRVLYIQSDEYSKNSMKREQWAKLVTGEFLHVVVPGATHRDLLLGTSFTPLLASILREHLERTLAHSS